MENNPQNNQKSVQFLLHHHTTTNIYIQQSFPFLKRYVLCTSKDRGDKKLLRF
jgi:hypothetical protein